VERFEGSNRDRKGLERTAEHGRDHLEESNALQEQPHKLGMGRREPSRVDAVPDFELKKPAGGEGGSARGRREGVLSSPSRYATATELSK